MDGHSSRVGSLAWNAYILSSGSRTGTIIHHDVRQRDHITSTLNGHTQEVFGNIQIVVKILQRLDNFTIVNLIGLWTKMVSRRKIFSLGW